MSNDYDKPEMVSEYEGIKLTRRGMLSAGAAATVAAAVMKPGFSFAQNAELRFTAALGWTGFDSGRHMVNGYTDAVERLGGTLTIADANYDVIRQSEQIQAFVESEPTAIFITPGDAAGISPAVQGAVDAGIPVFVGDSYVPNTTVVSTAMSNNFGMGAYNAQYIVDQLGGEGKVAMISLPQNETWDMRSMGARSVFDTAPGIEVVADLAWVGGGSATPRQIADQILTANPDVQAIWCAWDGAAIEGALAIRAAGRDAMTTGIDGGQQAFEFVQGGTAMKQTLAQSFYEMAYLNAFYAIQYANGQQVPRMIITPTYAVQEEHLVGMDELPDTYDQPGEAARLGWVRAL